MLHFRALSIIFAAVGLLSSCQDKQVNPNAGLRIEEYDSLRSASYRLSMKRIRREIRAVAAADSDSTLSDFYLRKFYADRHRAFVWIDRKGIDWRADTLAARLSEVSRVGFDTAQFRVGQIRRDLSRARRLDFGGDNINKVYARLEYNLTKALFRFSAGERFGYVNPGALLNRLDARETNPNSFYTLYGLRSPSAKKSFYLSAVKSVRNDSLSEFLDACEPRNPYYTRLVNILNSDSSRQIDRRLLLVNLERCRWRMADYPWNHEKYVLVNIPSLHLRAVDGGKAITMRIGCGSLKTKTPLLASNIKRMDINPQWIMPRSIVKKSIIPRLGNQWYFKSRHYFIRDRATGKDIAPWAASPAALLDGSQLAIQEGGEGNALGRIIFRFDNDFSIYLHDTSSREVFERADRDVSHGCIRVEKPFDLAVFLIGDGDRRTIERVRYSMNADVSPLGKSRDELTEKEQAVADTLQRKMLIGKVDVKPAVPVFIWYFTLFPDAGGTLRQYADLYGYDEIIYSQLRNFL